MNNDVVQEVAMARSERLLKLHPDKITRLVTEAIVEIAGEHVLQSILGVDAENDNVTKGLWIEATESLYNSAALTFPGWDGASQPVPAICSWELTQNVVAGRVARSIIVLHGFADIEVGQ